MENRFDSGNFQRACMSSVQVQLYEFDDFLVSSFWKCGLEGIWHQNHCKLIGILWICLVLEGGSGMRVAQQALQDLWTSTYLFGFARWVWGGVGGSCCRWKPSPFPLGAGHWCCRWRVRKLLSLGFWSPALPLDTSQGSPWLRAHLAAVFIIYIYI